MTFTAFESAGVASTAIDPTVLSPTVHAAGVLAHGVGSRQDLPIPFTFALIGAAAAVVVSFVAVGLTRRTPTSAGPQAGRPLPALTRLVGAAPWTWTLRILGLVVTGWILAAALLGPDDALNPTAGFVYVLLWVGLCVVASLVAGPVVRAVNPLRTLHLIVCRVAGRDPDVGLIPLPDRLGRWPAAAWLAGFLWLELAALDRATVPVLTQWFALFITVTLVCGLLFGATWFDRGDPFEAYSSAVARLAPFGRRCDGEVVLRSPIDGLEAEPPARGDAAIALVLLGGTLFDGLSNAPTWIRLTQSGPLNPPIPATFGLLACIAAVAAVYVGCARWAAHIAGISGRGVPQALAPSLIPIVVGYAVAHYYSLLVVVGQQTLQQMSDPLGTGADLLGIGGNGISYTWVQPTTVAVIQVLAVVTGHIVGVFSAHERGVRLFPTDRALIAQVPLLIAMVVFTLTGLSLLFAG